MTSKPQIQHCIACRFPNRIKHCQGSHPAIRFRCTVSQHSIFIFRPLLEVMHYFISICISIWPQGLYIHLVLTVLRFFPNTILPKDGETKDVLHFEQLHTSALGQNSEWSILHPRFSLQVSMSALLYKQQQMSLSQLSQVGRARGGGTAPS